MSRGYGYGSSPYYPTYYGGRSGVPGSYSSSGVTRDSRSSTPTGRSVTSMANSVLGGVLADDRKREMRSLPHPLAINHATAPVAYKYFTRSDFYNPTVIFNRSMSRGDGGVSKPRQEELKTIKTEDIDVESSAKDTNRDHAIPGAIKRDTGVVAGGKQVIRLVTTKQKSNPYNLVGRNKNNPDQPPMTMGQRLAMKHFQFDPKAEKHTQEAAAKSGESEGSDWTWETCSSSDEEGVTFVKNSDKSWSKKGPGDTASTTSTCSGRTISSSIVSVKAAQAPPAEAKADPVVKPYQSILQKYSKYTSSPKLNRKAETEPATTEPPIPSKKSTSYDWLRAPTKQTSYKTGAVAAVAADQKSSSSSASTPPLICKRYTGLGSKTVKFSSDEDSCGSDADNNNTNFRSAWRKGQPPRSDCVIKLSGAKKEKNDSRTTNKLLVSKDTPDTSSVSTPAAAIPPPPPSPPIVPSCHESQAEREMAEMVSEVSVMRLAPSVEEMQPLKVSKVTLPPLSFAVDSRISGSFQEEKLDRLKAPSYELNLQWGVAGQIQGVTDGPVLPSQQQEICHCPAAVRHNNSLADFAFSPTSTAASSPSASEPSTTSASLTSHSENYFPSDSDSMNTTAQASPTSPSPGCSVGSVDVPLTVVEIQEAMRSMENSLGSPVSSQPISETKCDIETTLLVSEENSVRNDAATTPPVVVKEITESAKFEVTPQSDIQVLKNSLSLDLVKHQPDHDKNHKLVNEPVASSPLSPPPTMSKLNGATAKAIKQSQSLAAPIDHHTLPSQNKTSLKHESHLQMVKDPGKRAQSGSEDESQASRSGSCSSAASLSIFGGISSELDASVIAAQLERIPSPMRKMFELRANQVLNPDASDQVKKGPPLSPDGEVPKYWNNKPKTDPNQAAQFINAYHEMSAMKSEQKKHQAKVKEEQMALLSASEGEPEEAWYKDESVEMQAQLQQRLEQCERRPSDLNNKPDGEKKSPEENMAIIQLYGGIQFDDSMELEVTPAHLLRKMNEFAEESDEDLLETESVVCQKTESCSSSEPPVKVRPKFRKYGVKDFRYLRVLGKGSFGKVILSELKDSQSSSFYAIKCLRKDLVLDDDDIECTLIERKVLALGIKHPFLCHLFCTFQTDSHMFFVMEYLNGGDLMFHIQQAGKFEEDRARFYSAEILTALRFMHKKGIVYRDLKLDNLLLDHEGHIRIADFGMCKLQAYLDRTTDTFCGTPDYMAPEIIKGLKYTFCVDWWSFGVLLYEMLIGQSPFNGCDEDELFWSICNEQPFYPKFITKEAIHILIKLLEKDPSRRLGTKSCPAGDVSDQAFFSNIDFAKVEKKQLKPPFRPTLTHPLDVSYFDAAFTKEEPILTPVDPEFLHNVNQMQFKGFSLTNFNYTMPD